MKPYDHKKIEPKWQKEWEKKKAFAAVDSSKKKKWYSLIEFPYPSGDGLHVGHIRSNTAMDIISRKRRREGFNVLYPIGWDAFGLPTENYAIKTGIQPAIVTKKNTATFRRQLKSLGFSFDWSREVNTTDPKYYKWTQWIFLQFLAAGLAYKKKMAINWCPKDLIGLANEEVVDGKCERCGTPVEKREKEQWMLAITKYADKLLEGLDATDYEMPKLIDKVNPHQPGAPLIERSVAHAIVFDPKNKKYLIIRNKKFGWDTVIIGGIEGDEKPEETARREVREETGYTDLEFKRILGGQTEAHYYTKHKGQNRIAFATGVYFELKSDARVAIDDADDREKGGHNEILWINEADFVPGKMVNSELAIWLERIKDPKAGWPKPLLDWPNFIKDSQRNWIGKSEGAEIDFSLKTKPAKVLIIHGFEGDPYGCFVQWLKTELQKLGHEVRVPILPNSYHPNFDEMMEVLKKEAADFGADDIIIGHSMGGHLALKIAEGKKLSKIILVAPAIGGFGIPYKEWKKEYPESDFDSLQDVLENHKPDFSKIDAAKKIALFGIDDPDVPIAHAENLDSSWNVMKFDKAGHFDSEKDSRILQTIVPSIKVFTTRPDTLFGVTYVVLAPEHHLVRELLPLIKNKSEALVYITKTKKESDIQRTDATREKTGVELKGVTAVNLVNGEEIPIFIADYVLADYGTGAVMAVPAHDDRDWEFAKKYGVPVKRVVLKTNAPIKSYLMGAERILDSDLEKVGVRIVEKKSDGDRTLILDPNKLSEYESLIKEKLSPGFWNEYISDEAIFMFKDKEGKISRFVLDKSNEEEIGKLSAQYVGEGWNKQSPWSWMAQNDWYKDIIIFTGEGKLINSAQFNNKDSSSIKKEITAFAGGQWISKYKLRDWVFSRQRYWGEPIPVVHCEKCGIVPVPEKDLPVKLPPVKNYKPTETGESPLAAISKWVNVKCPKCKGPAKRETDTMPNWAGSSWYYLRYTDPKNSAKFADMKKLKYWTPVDWYNGGMEHVTLHLLYSRFWHKFLFDQKLVPTSEPYTKRTAHGLVLGPGGEKMSKSRGNVINPDGIVKSVGADSLRLYEMFMGPFDQAIVWDENGIVGCRRFLERVWRLQEKVNNDGAKADTYGEEPPQAIQQNRARPTAEDRGIFQQKNVRALRQNVSAEAQKLLSLIHKTIKKVSEDIESMRFNTAVSALMILLNEFEKEGTVTQKNYEMFLQLLAPFAPHMTEELWNILGNKKSIHAEPWPTYDPVLLAESKTKIIIQINGKTRDEVEVASDASDDEVKTTALSLESVKKWLNGKAPSRIIVVKGRLINIVVAGS
jgi:leucyl-tRNA synthetase